MRDFVWEIWDKKIWDREIWERKTCEEIQTTKLTEKQWIDALIYSDMSFCNNALFKEVLKNQTILGKVSINLMKVHGYQNKNLDIFGQIDIMSEKTTKTNPDFKVEKE